MPRWTDGGTQNREHRIKRFPQGDQGVARRALTTSDVPYPASTASVSTGTSDSALDPNRCNGRVILSSWIFSGSNTPSPSKR